MTSTAKTGLRSKRILVTGANGFVGERVAGELTAAGAQVRCLDRDRSRAQALESKGHDPWEGDVRRPDTLAGADEGMDAAYYLVHRARPKLAVPFLTPWLSSLRPVPFREALRRALAEENPSTFEEGCRVGAWDCHHRLRSG